MNINIEHIYKKIKTYLDDAYDNIFEVGCYTEWLPAGEQQEKMRDEIDVIYKAIDELYELIKTRKK